MQQEESRKRASNGRTLDNMAPTDLEKPKVIRSVILITILTAGGIGLAQVLYAMRKEPPRREEGRAAPFVDYLIVQPEDIIERFIGYGTAKADRAVTLASEVSSTVTELVDGLEAGSVVLKGQLLVRLDVREYRHVLDRAMALVDADRAALDEFRAEAQALQELIATAEQELRVGHDEKKRVADLFERGLAAKKEYDFAILAYQQSRRTKQGYDMELAKNGPRQARLKATIRGHEAEAKLAALNVGRCEVRAPFDGTVSELGIDVGMHVGVGSPLLSILDPSHVEVPIQLPVAVYDRVRVGVNCRLESESMPGVTWSGRLARMGVSADRATRTFSVYVDVNNEEQSLPLIPGAFVRAVVEGPTYRDRLLVPRGVVREGRLLVADQTSVVQRAVAIERFIGDRAMVSGEVIAGDRVILSHVDRLAPGTTVRMRKNAGAAPSADTTPSDSSTRVVE